MAKEIFDLFRFRYCVVRVCIQWYLFIYYTYTYQVGRVAQSV